MHREAEAEHLATEFLGVARMESFPTQRSIFVTDEWVERGVAVGEGIAGTSWAASSRRRQEVS